jgi:Fic family protein
VLIKMEEWTAGRGEFNEDLIKRLHAVVDKGKRAKPTPYRAGQNVIRDSESGRMVYMPPEAKDVPGLMAAMVSWVRAAQKKQIPAPIIAALLHYQFVTIHPYYDGNGRTARLLSTFILQRDGYGLNGFFSMEEHHALNLKQYYDSLALHHHHNYYEGRVDADLSPWLSYFVKLLAGVFDQAKKEVIKFSKTLVNREPVELRKLDHRQRVVLSLFSNKERLTSSEIASTLGLSVRMARVIIKK